MELLGTLKNSSSSPEASLVNLEIYLNLEITHNANRWATVKYSTQDENDVDHAVILLFSIFIIPTAPNSGWMKQGQFALAKTFRMIVCMMRFKRWPPSHRTLRALKPDT